MTGVISTFAGSGSAAYADGIGTAASLSDPSGIIIDASGTNLFLTDYGNHRIRKIVILTGEVSTVLLTG